jgi:hypothetical protein
MSALLQKKAHDLCHAGGSASHLHGAIADEPGQELDYGCHLDKLLMLVARRGRQQANSDQIPKLDTEVEAVQDLLRSYRILKAME